MAQAYWMTRPVRKCEVPPVSCLSQISHTTEHEMFAGRRMDDLPARFDVAACMFGT